MTEEKNAPLRVQKKDLDEKKQEHKDSDAIQVKFLFENEKSFSEKKQIPVQVPGMGKQYLDTRSVVTSVATNLYNMLSALGQKRLMVEVKDSTSSLSVNKRLDIVVGQIPSLEDLNLKIRQQGENGDDAD